MVAELGGMSALGEPDEYGDPRVTDGLLGGIRGEEIHPALAGE